LQPTIPTLETERLRLRAFMLGDAPSIERLLDTPEISRTTLNLAYPYPAGIAERWIRSHGPSAEAGTGITWAITLRETGDVLGAVSLDTVNEHRRGALGYWLGVSYWNHGYMTEAIAPVIAFAFADLDYVRVEARHLPTNVASGRVMEKAGMAHEGTLRSYVLKDGLPVDITMRAIVRAL